MIHVHLSMKAAELKSLWWCVWLMLDYLRRVNSSRVSLLPNAYTTEQYLSKSHWFETQPEHWCSLVQLSSVSAPQEPRFQVACESRPDTNLDVQCGGAPSFTSSSFKSPSQGRAGSICHSASTAVDGSVWPVEFSLTVVATLKLTCLSAPHRSVSDVW